MPQTPKFVVEQDRDYDRETPDRPVYTYKVKRAYNTTIHPLGAVLSRKQISELIELGFNIEIQECS